MYYGPSRLSIRIYIEFKTYIFYIVYPIATMALLSKRFKARSLDARSYHDQI